MAYKKFDIRKLDFLISMALFAIVMADKDMFRGVNSELHDLALTANLIDDMKNYRLASDAQEELFDIYISSFGDERLYN